MQFRKKPVVIEAITFDQLVQHGRDTGANIVNNMPWSFTYKGQAITHENDQCYLIPTKEGTMRFTPDDMLITGVQGEIYPCKHDIFAATYEPVASEAQPPVDNAHVAPGCQQFSESDIKANVRQRPEPGKVALNPAAAWPFPKKSA